MNAEYSISPKTFTIIGCGRLGSNLALALNTIGWKPLALYTRNSESLSAMFAQRFGKLSDGLTGYDLLKSITSDYDFAVSQGALTFFTVPDSMVTKVAAAATHVDWSERVAIHCAGAMPLDVFNGLTKIGAAVGVFHPLQTFPVIFGQGNFAGASVACEGASDNVTHLLLELAATLGAQGFYAPHTTRVGHHAAAVMLCGLVAGLTGLAADILDDPEDLQRLLPLFQKTTTNIVEHGWLEASTGPLVRGDAEIVRLHLDFLRSRSPGAANAYAQLTMAVAALLKKNERITPAQYHEFRSQLQLPN